MYFQDREKLANNSLKKALRIRGKNFDKPIDIFEITKKHNIEVRFEDITSLEGLYFKSPKPTIILGANRPYVRQVFNCAHEFGHHVFGHNEKIDKLVQKNISYQNYPEEEFIADTFAGFLLMPPFAVKKSFKIRNWDFTNLTPIKIYQVSCNLGVGYETLIKHMYYSLKLISKSLKDELLKVKLGKLKREILGFDSSQRVVLVDRYWENKTIDLQVGDILLTLGNTFSDSNTLESLNRQFGAIYKAREPGIGRIISKDSEWLSFVRISRQAYSGLAEYRYLEESE